MKKSHLPRWFGTVLLLLSVLFAACGDNTAIPVTATTKVVTTNSVTTAAATAAIFPLELKDDAGRTVKLAKAATKIVSLAPSSTEILYALGLGDSVVGVDQFSNFPPEASKKEQVGSFSDINLEKVISLSPDLVFATSLHLKTVVPTLEQRNINVVVFAPKDLLGVVDNIKLVGKAAGVPEKGAAEAKNFQNRLDTVAAKVKNASKKASVFFDLGDLYTVASGSFLNDMIEKAGGLNIAPAGTNPYPQLTNEAIIAADPQVIILSSGDGGFVKDDAAAISAVSARAGWDKLTAVKNKNIRTVIADLTNRPGPRAAEGVEQIALALYPDLFK
ncbi:ABC transporter substrate-binding protein [Candidatus Chlorohelix sp.]|uniref:ABC transporter substrate-binding protein n=1 Tax=Candidatus Chlorohelix sp. TaxID=3139201 RepID=UPI0030669B93